MREIVFDTETTGVFPDHPEAEFRDRIVEIGCVEIINLERTGREFHAYLNPERSVPDEVVRVHGLTRDFLLQHKKFSEIADEFLAFIGDAPLVAHNAAFDQGFINAEHGWSEQELFGYDPWGGEDFGGAGAVAEDLIDVAFLTPTCP